MMEKNLRIVELSLAVMSAVKTNVLGANQVLALRHLSRNGKLDAVVIPRAPSGAKNILGLVAKARLEDLEPLAIALVLLDGAGGFGHVDEGGAGVLHGSAIGELHGHLGTGCDFLDARLASAGKGALVAAEVVHVGCHVVERVLPLGWVELLCTRVLADELVALGLLAVNDQDVEGVVGGGELRNGGSGDDGELHG
jgi:hypothetical protein